MASLQLVAAMALFIPAAKWINECKQKLEILSKGTAKKLWNKVGHLYIYTCRYTSGHLIPNLV